jgi:putative nucleotidyltransferase with HDIG domain
MTTIEGRESEVLRVIPELELIEDEELRRRVVQVWVRAYELSGADDLRGAIFLTDSVRDPEAGVEHVRAVIRLAVDAARTLRDGYGAAIDVGHVAAGAALHDVCKIVEYAPAAEGTTRGGVVHHAVMGAALALELGLPAEVAQIVEYHSSVPAGVDRSLEAHVVAAVDHLSFDAVIRRVAGLSLAEYTRGKRG